jgi:hypothetical protein
MLPLWALTKTCCNGVLAQLVEHHNGIVGVSGSNPLCSTTSFKLNLFHNRKEVVLTRTQTFFCCEEDIFLTIGAQELSPGRRALGLKISDRLR